MTKILLSISVGEKCDKANYGVYAVFLADSVNLWMDRLHLHCQKLELANLVSDIFMVNWQSFISLCLLNYNHPVPNIQHSRHTTSSKCQNISKAAFSLSRVQITVIQNMIRVSAPTSRTHIKTFFIDHCSTALVETSVLSPANLFMLLTGIPRPMASRLE